MGIPLSAAAQAPTGSEALRDLSLEQLGNIEVTTMSKQPSEVWRSASSIFVVTQDDIRRSGATSIPELLRLVPGVQVSRVDSDHWAVAIRGLTDAFSKSLLVLIDGRSVYTPLFGGVYWDVQDTLIEDIDRIEVIRGPGGTIWGANAVNGVINIVTKNSADTTGTLVSAGGGTVDQGRVAARFGGARGGALHYRVYGAGFSRDAEHHVDGREYDDWRQGQAGFRIDARRQGGQAFGLQGRIYQGRSGDQVGVGSFFPPAQMTITGDDRVSGGDLVASWQRDFDGGAGFHLQAYFDRTERTAPHYGEIRNTFDVDFLHHLPIGRRHNLSLGAGARSDPSDFTTVYSTLAFVPAQRSHHIESAFTQDEIALVVEKLWATVGAKFERNSDSGLEVLPSVRLLWRPTAHQTVWASATKAVRTPSRVDTDLRLTVFAGATTMPVYITVNGSPDFDAEHLVGFESGYRRLIGPQFYVDVTAFHNNYDGLAGFGGGTFSAVPTPILHAVLTVRQQNAVNGHAKGFEMAPDWKPAQWLDLRGGYSYLTIDMTAKPGVSADSQIANYEGASPRHQGFVSTSIKLPLGLEIDQSIRAVGRLQSHEVPSFVTGDARIGWQHGGLSLSLVGQNLFQDDHDEFYPDDRPRVGIRRSVYASATWRK